MYFYILKNNTQLNAANTLKMKRIQKFLESQTFGVCTRLGEKLDIPLSSIRIFFIYASFLTFGSPVILDNEPEKAYAQKQQSLVVL